MADRSIRWALFGIVALLALIAVQFHVKHSRLAASDEARTRLSGIEQSTIELFERVSPSVVQVSTITGADDPSKSNINIGSAFVWDALGNIVTNEHVVRGATTIWVWLASGQSVDAEVVGVAPNYDLAVIRFKQPHPLPPPIPIGTSKDLKVGQFAYAIGSPFGLDQSLTTGVIGALNRQLPTDKGQDIRDIIQTDAAIYPGNSGGPLLDSAGRLIGVNTISYALTRSHAALGFAIPVDLVKRIVPELIRAGRIPTAGIGIIAGDDKTAGGPQTGTTSVPSGIAPELVFSEADLARAKLIRDLMQDMGVNEVLADMLQSVREQSAQPDAGSSMGQDQNRQ